MQNNLKVRIMLYVDNWFVKKHDRVTSFSIQFIDDNYNNDWNEDDEDEHFKKKINILLWNYEHYMWELFSGFLVQMQCMVPFTILIVWLYDD